MFTPFRRTPPVLSTGAGAGLLLCVVQAAALWPGTASASENFSRVGQALAATDPAHPAEPPLPLRLPLQATPAGPQPQAERNAALAQWQQANARVADFPRGHIDILRWEAAQGLSDTSSDTKTPEATAFSALLTQALALAPDLMDQADLGALDRAERQAALADRVRQLQSAWLQAIAARAKLQRATDVLENARTGAELGRRMVVAGNWSPMKQLQERQTETAARQAWLSAQLAERVAIEQLGRELGLWQAAEMDALRRQLPLDLPAAPPQAPDAPPKGVEPTVLSAQAKLMHARAQAALQWRGAAPSPAWLAAQAEAMAEAVTSGAEGSQPLRLPLIRDPQQRNDHRSAHAAQTSAALLRQAAELRSKAREAWAALQTHHALARLAQDESLPQQEAMEQEVLQRYNGMFVSTWELLAAARARLAALDNQTDARLAYWLAEADWRALLAGGSFSGAQMASGAAGNGNDQPKGH